MIAQARLLTRAVTPTDLHKLANLVHFEAFIHRHLDYRHPLDWISQQPFCVLERHGEIIAALACPPDPPKIAWIRLFAVSSHIPTKLAWQELWSFARGQLENNGNVTWAAALPMHSWFSSLLEKSSFSQSQCIALLRWDGDKPPEQKQPAPASIRPMTLDDMQAVQFIDHAAFTPVWQNSFSYLELGFRQAIIATVAESFGKLVGYQISIETPIGGHLSRLAIDPAHHGKGIGYALLHDLLTQFERRGVRAITVNTQKDNLASLSLYRKAGFRLTGEEYPFYQLALGAE